MKHLLTLLISILVLSSTVIGQETGVLYQFKLLQVLYGKLLEKGRSSQSMKENGRTGKNMAKGLLLGLMEESM